MQAIWNGIVIADSDNTIYIEGNKYFPPDSVNKKFLESSGLTSVCHWKGTAGYFNLIHGDKKSINAAWYYSNPLPGSVEKVKHDFKDYIAFYPNVVTIAQ
jgi:uncharacterized protein (DUF427 family)